MSTFRTSKLENYINALLRRKDILKNQLMEGSLDDLAKQYISGRISELDMIIYELVSEFGIDKSGKDDRQPEKKGQTIQRLIDNGEQDKAEKLRTWRNSKGTHFGWDSWFVSEYGEEFARKYNIHTVLVSKK